MKPNVRYDRLRIAEMAKLKRGWNMRQLSDYMQLGHQTVLYWNQGRTAPRFDTFTALCVLLGCQPSELISVQFKTEDGVSYMSLQEVI